MAETFSVSPLRPLQRFARLVSNERRDIVSIFIFAIVAGLISLSLPLGIQAIFNYVSGGAVTTSWVVLLVIVILGVIANGVLQVFQILLAERIQQRIFTHAAFEFAYRIPRLRIEALRNAFAPELINRFFDTLTVQKSFSKILMDFSTSTLQIVFGLVLLSFYHPFFIIFSLVLLVLLGLVLRITGPYGLRASLEESKYKYKLVFWLTEMARTLETFKLAGDTKLPLEKTDRILGSYLSARNRHFKVLLTEYGVILAFKVLIISALLLIGSLLVFNNELNIGQFVAMEIVVILLLSAVEKVILSMENIYDILTALEKVGTVTDLPLEAETGEPIPAGKVVKGLALELKDLSLQFPDQRRPTIEQINLKVSAGARLQIVAQDDSWVMHFFRLLTGFYSGYTGTISYNGLPLQNVHLEDLRHQVGGYSSLQEIFEGSILENILVGIPNLGVERALELIDAVGLQDFLHEERLGIHSPLNAGGHGLPELIQRKLMLARSLATHPKLLLLNRPFEDFLPAEKDKFLLYLQRHLPDSTVIIVSDEPENIAFVQQTYILQGHTLVHSNA